jgi:hypothetical protein
VADLHYSNELLLSRQAYWHFCLFLEYSIELHFQHSCLFPVFN